jgi:hypothetical protein
MFHRTEFLDSRPIINFNNRRIFIVLKLWLFSILNIAALAQIDTVLIIYNIIRRQSSVGDRSAIF